MYQNLDFKNQMILIGKKNARYPTLVAEMSAIATALDADTSKHDLTIAKPPAALKPGHKQTPFTNEALLLVNRGKAGNLVNSDMADAITASLGLIEPPVVVTAPHATGTATVGSVLSCTQGTWSYAPTHYAYQWLRNGGNITGATAATYTLAAADSSNSISCRVTATNPAGSASSVSNAIAVTFLGTQEARSGVEVIAKGGGPLPGPVRRR
jgi:hypothetical protein